jgi:hypothetical protein
VRPVRLDEIKNKKQKMPLALAISEKFVVHCSKWHMATNSTMKALPTYIGTEENMSFSRQ